MTVSNFSAWTLVLHWLARQARAAKVAGSTPALGYFFCKFFIVDFCTTLCNQGL
jgi:hypothetical protein